MRCYTLEDGSVEIEVEREATLNPTDPASRIKRICGHMWADEMKAALKSMGASGYSGNMKFKNMQWICNKSPTRVRPLVYRFLQARENWRPGSSNS
jgi:protein gp37